MDGSSAPGDQGRVQSPSAIAIQHPSYVRRNLWNTANDSVLLARCSLSLSFFLTLSPCLPLCRPSVHPPSRSIRCSLSRRTLSPRSLSQPPPVYRCVEEEELQHPPADVSAVILMDRAPRSSPPDNHVNPINALRRPQTKKSPPGTPELPRVRHVSVLKCPLTFGLLPSVDLIARRSSHGK